MQHHDDRGIIGATRLTKHTVEVAVLVRNLDPLTGRVHMGMGQGMAFNGFFMGGLQLIHMFDKYELAEVINHRRGIEMNSSRNRVSRAHGLFAGGLMLRSARRKNRTPIVPALKLVEHFLIVGRWNTVRYQTRRPT